MLYPFKEIIIIMFRKKTKLKDENAEKTFLAIDIGTQNIKTAVCRIEGSKVNILGYDRTQQVNSAMSKAIILDQEKVTDALDVSIGNAMLFAKSKFNDVELPKSCIIGLSGELVSGVPVTVNLEREDPTEPVTKAELADIIAKVITQTFNSSRLEIAEDCGLEENMIAEAGTYIDSIYLDGQAVSNPEGFAGKDMLFKVFTTFAPSLQVQSIFGVTRHFDLKLEKLMVEPYAIAKSLVGIPEVDDGAIIIDIGAGTTDVAIIKNNEVWGVRMYGIGGRAITKRISNGLGIEFDEGEKLKIDYSNELLDEEKTNTVRRLIQEELKIWLVGLEVSLRDLDFESYPARMFLCGGGVSLPDITNSLLEYSWNKVLPFSKHPKVSLLLPNKIVNVVDLTRTMNSPIDLAPAALAQSIKFI
jgi:cell division protein FtsA